MVKLEKENKQDDGKALSCLKHNLQKLSPACKAAELKNQASVDLGLKRALLYNVDTICCDYAKMFHQAKGGEFDA